MTLEPVLAFSHTLLAKAVKRGDIAIDATVGNGKDTEFLAELVGKSGTVYGFDIQERAISRTKRLLAEKGLDHRVVLFQKGHETILETLPENLGGQVAGAIFNLGYLPKGDHSIITKPETTIPAVRQILSLLKPGGLMVLVIYQGHHGGERERDCLLKFAKGLDQREFNVLKYQYINQKNAPPFLLAIEKR
jgi:Putative rRNA methylase.